MTMEARARKKLLPEIETPSEAVQEWVDKHIEDVVETAEELSEGGEVEVPTSDIVEIGLGVEPEEPRFDEIAAAAENVLKNKSKGRTKAKRDAGQGRPDKTPPEGIDGTQTPIKQIEQWVKPNDESVPNGPPITAQVEGTEAETQQGKNLADEAATAKSSVGHTDEAEELVSRLQRSEAFLANLHSSALIRALMRILGLSTGKLRDARRDIRAAIGQLREPKGAVGTVERAIELPPLEFVGSAMLRTQYDIYRALSDYVVEGHTRRDPQRVRGQRVSNQAVKSVLEMLDHQPRSTATLAQRVQASGPGSMGFLYTYGPELRFEVQRALLVGMAEQQVVAIPTPIGFVNASRLASGFW